MGKSTLAALLLCAACMLATAAAAADTWRAVINGKSHHFDSSYDWNEDNFGFGVEYHFESGSRWKPLLMANGFRDSNDEMSYMAGGGLHRRLFETHRLQGLYIDAGINAFLMTRGDVNDNRPFPGILPSLTIGNRQVGLNVTYLPKVAVEGMLSADFVDPTLSGILFLQLKIGIDQLLPIN